LIPGCRPSGSRTGEEEKKVPRTKASAKPDPKQHVVNFDFRQQTYQIDPERQKVYRRFVEIETSRAIEIYSSWRATNAHP
jgi:hypothetical protein